jgi:DNA polymerase
MPTLSLDIESRSKINLKNCGAWRYCAHASTEPLFMCWTVDDDAAVQTWRQGDPVPVPFLAATNAPADWSIVAHNYQFELPFYELILARFGFPPIPLASWHCTMRLALANAYPAELGLLSQALGLPYRKDAKAIKALREVSARRRRAAGTRTRPSSTSCISAA